MLDIFMLIFFSVCSRFVRTILWYFGYRLVRLLLGRPSWFAWDRRPLHDITGS